jgi:hypothetical protein
MAYTTRMTKEQEGKFKETSLHAAGTTVSAVKLDGKIIGVVYRKKAKAGPQVLPWNGALFRISGDFSRLVPICSINADKALLMDGRTRAASSAAHEEAVARVELVFENSLRCADCGAIQSVDKIADAIRLMSSLSKEAWVEVVTKSADISEMRMRGHDGE